MKKEDLFRLFCVCLVCVFFLLYKFYYVVFVRIKGEQKQRRRQHTRKWRKKYENNAHFNNFGFVTDTHYIVYIV